MKNTAIILVASALIVSSCGSYTGQGAYAGGSLGSVIGSAIGGISSGRSGSDIGKIVGMAGGAAIGAAIGAAADKKQQAQIQKRQQQQEQAQQQREQQQREQQQQQQEESGFDASNSGDDRIDFDASGPRNTGNVDATHKSEIENLAVDETMVEIRNAHIEDSNKDGLLQAGEECQVMFDIMNHSSQTLYNVQPVVLEVSSNKDIHISPNLMVESIAPNSGVRYTATILADKKLKDGKAVIRVGVMVGKTEITSQLKEFTVETRKN